MQKLENLKRGLQRSSVQFQQNKRMTNEVLLSKLEMLLDADRSENLAEIIDTKIHLLHFESLLSSHSPNLFISFFFSALV